jgi:hypothetical protein
MIKYYILFLVNLEEEKDNYNQKNFDLKKKESKMKI